jgi:RND family efflux transporter MFP subunit
MVRDALKRQLLNLNLQLADQRIEYDQALLRYETMDDPANLIAIAEAQTQLAAAEAGLAEAQRGLEAALAGPTAGEIAAAESELARTQAEWAQLRDGPDPDEVELLETKLAAAQARLLEAQQEPTSLELAAPVSGMVLSIEAAEGERVGQQTVLTLADLSQPILDVYLDEADLQQLDVGDAVAVVFDAYPDQTYSGQIQKIDPSLTEIDGAKSVRAEIALNSLEDAGTTLLPVGLSATVDVIVGQATGAVLIPVEALTEISPDKYAVYVVQNGSSEQREVTVGLSDFTSAEILTGLTAGETVSLASAAQPAVEE